MAQYRINDLERLTGVKAHTIRIWEKRYMLISPLRTATNRRYYSDAQLLKLMNVSTLLEHGFKISHLAAMTDEELAVQIEELHRYPSGSTACTAYIHELTAAMVAFNETTFKEVFAAAVTELGFYEAMMNVFYPFLRKAGLLWRTDKAVAIQEHFATCIIRNKIIIATDMLPAPAADAKRFMLFLPSEEWHEVGLLFANYLIRAKGHATIYLGQSVPDEDIRVVKETINPDYMFAFFISPKPTEELENDINLAASINENIPFYISGDGSLIKEVKFKYKNIIWLQSVNDLMEIL